MQGRYLTDKNNAKLLGVCAGLARATGIDPLIVRLVTLVLAFATGPIALIVYLALAWIADEG